MATPNIGEIITTTIRNRSRRVFDNVTKNAPLLARLKARKRLETRDGGRTITEALSYPSANVDAQWYSGYQQLDVSPSERIDAADYAWKQAASVVTIDGLSQIQNSGESRILPLLKQKIRVAEQDMANILAAGLYSDGTGNNGKEIGGLQLLVGTTPTTGIVGGINRATYSFWRNYVKDQTATADNIEGLMNDVYINTTRNADMVDLISLDGNLYKFFLEKLQDRQRYTNPNSDLAKEGFPTLQYMTADVVNAGGVEGLSPVSRGYFLNTKHLRLVTHPQYNMTPSSERKSIDQDAIVRLIFWAGNLVMSNARLQGVIEGS